MDVANSAHSPLDCNSAGSTNLKALQESPSPSSHVDVVIEKKDGHTDRFDELKELHPGKEDRDAVTRMHVVHVAPRHTDSVEHDHQTGPSLNNGQLNSIQVEPQQSVL